MIKGGGGCKSKSYKNAGIGFYSGSTAVCYTNSEMEIITNLPLTTTLPSFIPAYGPELSCVCMTSICQTKYNWPKGQNDKSVGVNRSNNTYHWGKYPHILGSLVFVNLL